MAQRDFSKGFKTGYDMVRALDRASGALGALGRLDPDRRSSIAPTTQQKAQIRANIGIYRKNIRLFEHLLNGKFAKYNKTILARMDEIVRPTGPRGRPVGSGRKNSARRQTGKK
jgi:hypothetical protein